MQTQKRRFYNQLGGVNNHQVHNYLFRVSEGLKIETGSQRDITKYSAIGCPIAEPLPLKARMG